MATTGECWTSTKIERSPRVVTASVVIGSILFVGALVRCAVWPSRVYCDAASCPVRSLSFEGNIVLLAIACGVCTAVFGMAIYILCAPGVFFDWPYRDKGFMALMVFLVIWSLMMLIAMLANDAAVIPFITAQSYTTALTTNSATSVNVTFTNYAVAPYWSAYSSAALLVYPASSETQPWQLHPLTQPLASYGTVPLAATQVTVSGLVPGARYMFVVVPSVAASGSAVSTAEVKPSYAWLPVAIVGGQQIARTMVDIRPFVTCAWQPGGGCV
eukprot:TRINITY_DN8148_c0_g1_i1.p1 TRINITY_DN8148_c0_g1~~TRINITY_DN8148_c0_g1_i1.p1  ORF type:complete len:279 (-),score=25.15 TRINITY_DN8148_c0_g1_i1:188-1003(-)